MATTERWITKVSVSFAGCGLCAIIFLIANDVLVAGGTPSGSSQANPALKGGITDQEQALRERVEELYGLLQTGRWTEAESYVTEDSLEAFRSQKRNPVLGFQVGSVKLDAGGQTATVDVGIQAVTPFSAKPMIIPQSTRWRLVNGAWRVIVPEPPSATDLFNPVVKKAPPTPEELKFKGHRYELGKVLQGEAKVAYFPFTNVSTHPVRITEVLTGCDCLQAKLEKKEYKPGESGELRVEFDSAGYKYSYQQAIIVETDPGDLKTRLVISAYVKLPPPPKASAPDRQTSSSPDAHGHGH